MKSKSFARLATATISVVLLSGCISSPAEDTSSAQGISVSSLPDVEVDEPILRGVNVAGGEFTHTPAGLPGKQFTQYKYPTPRLLTYLYGQGHRVVRLPFRWERVQHTLGGPLNETGIGELDKAIKDANNAGLLVILDMHNYGDYTTLEDTELMLGAGVTTAHYADIWSKLSKRYSNQIGITGFGLMNEPNALPASPTGSTTWKTFSQAAVEAIRSAGDTQTDVYVAGDHWGGAQRWESKNGAPWINDPAGKVVYEAHYYFAPNNSGTYPSFAQVEADAVKRGWPNLEARVTDEMDDFTSWLKKYDQRGFIGEIGWPNGPEADQFNAIGEVIYDVLDENGVSATAWSTGDYWGSGYALEIYDHNTLTPNSQAKVVEAHSSVISSPKIHPAIQRIKPSAATTGDRSGVERKIHVGDLIVTTPGAVIEHMEIQGHVIVKAPNVLIRNSVITGRDPAPGAYGLVYAKTPGASVTVQDSELYAAVPSPWVNGVMGYNIRLERVNIHDTIDSVHILGDNVTILDSYLHDTTHFEQDPQWNGGPSHDDNIQVQVGSNITIVGNTVEGATNAAIQYTQDQGPVKNVHVEGNWFDDGGCTLNIADKTYGPYQEMTYIDNVFGYGMYYANCAILVSPGTRDLLEMRNNTYTDGKPVLLKLR